MIIQCFLFMFFVFYVTHHASILDYLPGGGLTMDIRQYPPLWNRLLAATAHMCILPVVVSCCICLLVCFIKCCQYNCSPFVLFFFFLALYTNCIPPHHPCHHHLHYKTTYIKWYILSRTIPARIIDHTHDPPWRVT